MKIGEHIQEAIDFMGRGLQPLAFVATCAAITETLKKAFAKDVITDDDLRRFIKENWELISFMCLPRALPLPLNVPFGVKRIEPKFNVHHGAEEIVLLIINKTKLLGRLPEEFVFYLESGFEIKQGKLYIPNTLVSGLLSLIVVHPANKNETIPDKYWMNISDFKMFVSELWGRIDLAERVRKFYLERD